MRIPHFITIFLEHGLWIVMAIVALYYASKAYKLSHKAAAVLLSLGALGLIFSKAFRMLTPLSETKWSSQTGCCYLFESATQLGAYFSVQLAPIVSSMLWLVAVALILRNRSVA